MNIHVVGIDCSMRTD